MLEFIDKLIDKVMGKTVNQSNINVTANNSSIVAGDVAGRDIIKNSVYGSGNVVNNINNSQTSTAFGFGNVQKIFSSNNNGRTSMYQSGGHYKIKHNGQTYEGQGNDVVIKNNGIYVDGRRIDLDSKAPNMQIELTITGQINAVDINIDGSVKVDGDLNANSIKIGGSAQLKDIVANEVKIGGSAQVNTLKSENLKVGGSMNVTNNYARLNIR